MFIQSFTVKNYRSITNANELPLYKLSILIGPNNEGKSNILKALVMTLNIIHMIRHRRFPVQSKSILKSREQFFLSPAYKAHISRTSRYRGRRVDEEDLEYSWERDFPINLQKDHPNAMSEFIINFSLTEREKSQLQTIVNKRIVGNLRAEIVCGTMGIFLDFFDTHVPKKRLKQLLDIARFISNKIQVQYISAIRTQSRTISTIDNMISGELTLLENRKDYQNLLKSIEKKQKPVLDKLSSSLTKSVSSFLPQVKKIHLDSKELIRRVIHESTDVYVDDGTNTLLELKGDGIKSLIAISILQHITKQYASGKRIILAIEEPESHLHPEAIHKLKKVLDDISAKNQVIISTHSPLLVNRGEITRNLIVNKSNATSAKSIADIRDILGVKIADNLHSANLIILTEGEDDSILLKSWISQLSNSVKSAIDNGDISFDNLAGGNNLAYKVSLWKGLLCDVRAFLDNDDTGNNGFAEASSKGLITLHDVTFSTVTNYKESEIEDLVDVDTYKSEIMSKYGVNLEKSPEFRNSKRKWSFRMREAFKKSGKIWNDGIKAEVKRIVTQKASAVGLSSLNKHQRKPVKLLVESLEEYLASKANP